MVIASFIPCSERVFSDVLAGVALKNAGSKPPDAYLSPPLFYNSPVL